MENVDDLRRAVEVELERRKKRVLNKHAFDALFATIPGGSLARLFLRRGGAVEDERRRIQVDLVLQLLLHYDNAIKELHDAASEQDISISGLIEAHGADSEAVTGVRIGGKARNVEIKPGTHIRAEGNRVKQVTGLDIGGE